MKSAYGSSFFRLNLCAFTALLFVSAAWGQAAPSHIPIWKNGVVSYGISDDIQDTNADGIAHTSGKYPYDYCRRGVWLDDDKPNAQGKLKFDYRSLSGGTEIELRNNLFVLKKKFGLQGGPIVGGNGIGWSNIYKPKFDLQNRTLTLKVEPDKTKYYLFRYLDFSNQLICASPDGDITGISSPDPVRKKLIVFVHGWNRWASDAPYSSTEWSSLYSNWLAVLRENNLDWDVVRYDWHTDAATGGVIFNKAAGSTKIDSTGIFNATEAAEISHMHGQHLGELLFYLFPNLEKVHFLAHSAGSWAARTAARHLLLQSNADVQITLLDPFMPKEGGSDDSSLGKNVMNKLDSIGTAEHLLQLENYFSWDDDFAFGTQETFLWRPQDVAGHRVDFWDVVKTDFHVYGDHAGPIQFYADSLRDEVRSEGGAGPSDFGWRKSMALAELSATEPVAAFTATPTSGAAPLIVQFSDQSTPGTSPITGWSWDFKNDGTIDSTEPNPQYTFDEPGIYDVELTVATEVGFDTLTHSGLIQVSDLSEPTGPVVAFSATPTSGAAPLIVQFSDQSTPGTSPITEWSWDFKNDGTIDSTEPNPQYTFDEPGIYDVELTVATEVGFDTLTHSGFIEVSNAPEIITWTRTYRGFSFAVHVQKTADGGYIVACESDIHKLLYDGTIQWSKYVGSTCLAYDCKPLDDNGYIYTGRPSSGPGYNDANLVKLDPSGNLVWSKTFGGTSTDRSYCVIRTSDGGYALAGSTRSFGAGSDDMYLVKTDSAGNLLWFKTFGGTSSDWAKCVIQAIDGGYVLLGHTDEGSSGIYLVKTDSNGNLLWSKTFGDDWYYFGHCVKQTTDGGYILSGFVDTGGIYIVKLDRNDSVVWEKLIHEASGGYSIEQTPDGGYIVAGEMNQPFDASSCLVKLDSSGNFEWSKNYGEHDHANLTSVFNAPGGGYIIGGSQYLVPSYRAVVIKTDSLGNAPDIPLE